MPNKNKKSSFYAKIYPEEFIKRREGELWCNLCSCIVSSDRKSNIDSHRKTKKYISTLTILKKQDKKVCTQTFLNYPDENFLDLFVKAFVSSNTPLNKLNNENFKYLFSYLENFYNLDLDNI